MSSLPLVLASASPRRRDLCRRLGISVEVEAADIDEAHRPGESPGRYVARVAGAKADAVAARYPERFVLAADTIVEVDGQPLGKAATEDEARGMLRRLVGRSHRVSTAFAIRGPAGQRHDQTVSTEVTMRAVGDDEIADYVSSGEWRGKAGAYAVQGIAAALVTEVRGSITNVIGLPLAEVVVALSATGAARVHYQRGEPA